jgi:predicted ATPase
VQEKTAGSPFFVIQFLHTLAAESLLAFDHNAARWRWDLQRIHAKGYTDNVVDLMAAKLSRLPVETQQALQQMAFLGNTAETTMLTIVLQITAEQVHAALWPAVRQELVERVEGSYKFVHEGTKNRVVVQRDLGDDSPLGACPSSRGLFGTNLIAFEG